MFQAGGAAERCLDAAQAEEAEDGEEAEKAEEADEAEEAEAEEEAPRRRVPLIPVLFLSLFHFKF